MMLFVDEKLPGVGLMKEIISGSVEAVVMANFLQSIFQKYCGDRYKKLDRFTFSEVIYFLLGNDLTFFEPITV